VELRQLRYFVRVVEFKSMGRAALELGVGTSALSQQISRLERELSTRLLQRTSVGVTPTDAGLAFWRQAQLVLRHADDAVSAAQLARLSGHVSVGLAPSTTGIVGMRFLGAMRERYPDVRLRLVESLSGHLESMLEARQIDLAILFGAAAPHRFSSIPLLDERLLVIYSRSFQSQLDFGVAPVALADLAEIPLLLPSPNHGLRALIDQGFAKANCVPRLIAEIDGLAMLMDAVGAGLGITIQPGAALARQNPHAFRSVPLDDASLVRPNSLVCLSDDELSPAGLAARVVMTDVVRTLVMHDDWVGATLI